MVNTSLGIIIFLRVAVWACWFRSFDGIESEFTSSTDKFLESFYLGFVPKYFENINEFCPKMPVFIIPVDISVDSIVFFSSVVMVFTGSGVLVCF